LTTQIKNLKSRHRLAGWLAESAILRSGKMLFEKNTQDWNMPLSRLDKLQAGAYVILRDYARGIFPPRYNDRSAAYQAEIDYPKTLPGMTPEEVAAANMQKPFWNSKTMDKYLREFCLLCECFRRCGIAPPARVMELGCGHGWTTEFLATMGYEMMGTSIVEEDIIYSQKRIDALRAKGLNRVLNFKTSPMESVAEQVGPKNYYDAVFVFEALHHAFDWREAIHSASECLKPGGWLLLCNEPNVLHTFISYRVARLSNTHEIGMSRRKLIEQMQNCGMTKIINMSSPLHFWIKPHWICAQKTISK
jgi:2-polyprenyl-3-methyl-5-hydroxy-6-metoxy-1,4-benzoquinol methylase